MLLREEASDGPRAQSLLSAFAAEIAALYPSWTPNSGPSAEPGDFRPPLGQFVVAYLDP